MAKDLETWWNKHRDEIFWYKYRLMNGLDPNNPEPIKEAFHWRKIRQKRQRSLESNDPDYAIKNAIFFDKQYLLQKWWETFNKAEKRYYLIYVWCRKGDGNLYGFDWWLPFFEELGFVSNRNELRPADPMILYRASEPIFSKGMSWTDRKSVV